MKTLRDRVAPGVWQRSLAEVLDEVAKYATVTRTASTSDAKGLALALLVKLPPDYIEFVTRFGSLRVDGDDRFGFGQLEVFGAATVQDARQRFRVQCDRWAGPPDWRQQTDKRYAQLQRAYRDMVPVIQLSDVMHQSVDCVGRDGRMYVVDIKSWQIEPDHGRSFTAQLLERLAGVVVR